MKRYFLLFLLCFYFNGLSQEMTLRNNESGLFSLGSRSTFSLFNEGKESSIGMGVGGQFRLQIAPQVNTEWFFDYLSSNINDVINRSDFHIGWSVMYYPLHKNKTSVIPYLVAGHCFDQSYYYANTSNSKINRFSSAVQTGLGTHLKLSNRIDFTILTQYMIHLGKEIIPFYDSANVTFSIEDHTGWEGHLLITFGINYKIIDLW